MNFINLAQTASGMAPFPMPQDAIGLANQQSLLLQQINQALMNNALGMNGLNVMGMPGLNMMLPPGSLPFMALPGLLGNPLMPLAPPPPAPVNDKEEPHSDKSNGSWENRRAARDARDAGRIHSPCSERSEDGLFTLLQAADREARGGRAPREAREAAPPRGAVTVGAPGVFAPSLKRCGRRPKDLSLEQFEAIYGPEPSLLRQCTNCACRDTPQWRKGPDGVTSLCNRCGVQYRLGRLLPRRQYAALVRITDLPPSERPLYS